MTTECGFCKGTGKEEGFDGCVWCCNTGRDGGIQPEALKKAIATSFAKGDTDPVGDCDKFEAGIHVGAWLQRIVVYGDTPADAEALRDELMALVAERDSLKGQLDTSQARRRQFAEEVNGRLNALDHRVEGLEERTARLRHVGMELTGVIDEYRAMPCKSLQMRMFQTADRYRKRLTAKCGNCEDHGVIGYTTGQTPETFDQGDYPCPECHPAEYAAWRKP